MIIYSPLSFTPLTTRISLISLDLLLLLTLLGLILITWTSRPTFSRTSRLIHKFIHVLLAAITLSAVSELISLIHAILVLPFTASRTALYAPTIITSTLDGAASLMLTTCLLYTLHCHIPSSLQRFSKLGSFVVLGLLALFLPVNLGLAAHWLRWRLSESYNAALPRRQWGAALVAQQALSLMAYSYVLLAAAVLYYCRRMQPSKTPLRLVLAALWCVVREVNALLTVGLALLRHEGGRGKGMGGALVLQTLVAGFMTVVAYAAVAMIARANEGVMGGGEQEGLYRDAMVEAVRGSNENSQGFVEVRNTEKAPVLPEAAAMGRV